MTTQPPPKYESFKVSGENLLERFKQLVHEGNVRRIVITHGDHTVVEFPLTVGVIGIVLAPMVAAVGALAAVLTECTIIVERTTPPEAGGADEMIMCPR